MSKLTYKGRNHLPLPKGPYSVGCIDVMTEHSDRGCFMRLYYPCVDDGILEHHQRWPRWAPDKDYVDAFVSISELPLLAGQIQKTFNKLYIPAIWDSPPLSKGGPYPLIVFSHGLTACRTTYSSNHLELASRGYVVAAVEHRDGSACFTYYLEEVSASKDGQRKEMISERRPIPLHTKSISSQFFTIRNKQVHQRAEECIRALDLLKDVNEGNSPKNLIDIHCELSQFQGLFDMSRVALIGHSFGGAAALLALSKDSRFRVGVAFDPWTMPIHKEEDLPKRLSQPVLIVSSQGFYSEEQAGMIRKIEKRKEETKCVTIKNTTHMSQSDVPFIMPESVLIRLLRLGTLRNYRDKHTHLDIHNSLMMLFLAKHLDLSVDNEFQACLDDNSSVIMEGIISSPAQRRIYILLAGAFLILSLLTSSWYLFQ